MYSILHDDGSNLLPSDSGPTSKCVSKAICASNRSCQFSAFLFPSFIQIREEERTHPPTRLFRRNRSPVTTNELSSAECGRREKGEDVGEDFRREEGDRGGSAGQEVQRDDREMSVIGCGEWRGSLDG
jgi:hypothetical protein